MKELITIPSITTFYNQTGKSTTSNEIGMRPMQERAFEKRGEQYLLIKSPPASGKSRALMFIALDKFNQKIVKEGYKPFKIGIGINKGLERALLDSTSLADFYGIENFANQCSTISNEIITSIGQRVKRVYV